MAATPVAKGSLVYKDATNKGRAKIVIQAKDGTAISKANMVTLAGVIATHTDCTLVSETALDIQREDSAAGAGNKDRKGIVTGQEANGRVHRWAVPGIKAADCEVNPNTNGEYIKVATAQILLDGFAAATGLTLDLLPCPVIQTR